MPYPYVEALANHTITDIETARAIQTELKPELKQDVPFDAKQMHADFCTDFEKYNNEYFGKRETVTGVVMWLGEDIHHKHSIQLSDKADGDCYVHCVIISADHYAGVKVGDTVVMKGNYLECHPEFGVVLKMSEVVK